MGWISEIGFERPGYLLLLVLLPLLWALSFRSLAGLGRWRRMFALTFRTAVFAALVLALAKTQWRDQTDQLTVIYLLDQSESIPREKRDFMLDYVHREVARHRRDEDRAGVIVFGRNAKIESAPFDGDLPLIGRIESGFDLETNATNLEAAMKLAKASFPEGTARRIVIVSDGNENLGDAMAMAQSLAEDGTGIDVVPVALFATSEVSVEKVALPTTIRRGQAFEARVVVNNDTAVDPDDPDSGRVSGRLRFTKRTSHDREELIGEQQVVLAPGKNVFTFPHKVEQADVFTFQATFVPEDPADDKLTQNNTASAFSHVRGKGRVLLIEDGNHRGEFLPLVERLQANDIEVELMPSTSLYTSAAELLQYDSIVLANVPRATGDTVAETAAFSDDQIRMLVQNCEEMGCGLVMIGGDRSFGAGGWSNSELEKAMPVDFQIKNDKIDAVGALAMMMHACELSNGNFWQMKTGQVAIDVLGPMDYCGVVEWSNFGGTPSWLWRLPDDHGKNQPIARVYKNRKTMKSMVGRMKMGDMPDFNAPMQLALNGLLNTDAAMKHMIIISDGDPTPPSKRLLNDFIKNKIKISTVAIGTHGPAGSTPLKSIAQATGGKYYVVTNPRALPKIYQREARRVAKPVIKESRTGMLVVPDSMAASHEILSGIDVGQLPPFYGYVMTTVKNNPLVEQILMSNDPPDNRENTTLLATWRYGVGRATVFTSDAGNVWTADWYNTPLYDKFFTQLIRHSMRPITQSANFTVGTEVRDNRARIVVNALDDHDEFLNFLNIYARGIRPDLESVDLEFTQTAPGRYEAELDVDQSGSYLFSIFPGEGYERLTAGISVPYSSEYTDRAANTALLESLASLKPREGEVGVVSPQSLDPQNLDDLLQVNTFRPTLRHESDIRDIWPWLVLLGGVIFFTDVLIRRVAFRFDWVGQWLASFKSRDVDKETESRIARLQSRKVEIEQQIESKRAATRFAPAVDSEPRSGKEQLERVIGDEIDETADRRRPRPKPHDQSLNVEREESYTSRLLAAKRRAQHRNRESKSDGPDQED